MFCNYDNIAWNSEILKGFRLSFLIIFILVEYLGFIFLENICYHKIIGKGSLNLKSKNNRNKLEDLVDELHCQKKTKDIESQFDKIAYYLFKKYKIVSGEKEVIITDLEFYYYTNNHKDIFTHKSDTQLNFLKWYTHFGIDITIGKIKPGNTLGSNRFCDNTDNVRGGILIRGIKIIKNRKNELYINGPSNVADYLLGDMGNVFQNKTSAFKFYLDEFPEENEKESSGNYIKAPRANLTLKCNNKNPDKEENDFKLRTDFLLKPYRYIKSDEYHLNYMEGKLQSDEYKNFAEKKLINNIANKKDTLTLLKSNLEKYMKSSKSKDLLKTLNGKDLIKKLQDFKE